MNLASDSYGALKLVLEMQTAHKISLCITKMRLPNPVFCYIFFFFPTRTTFYYYLLYHPEYYVCP